MDGQRFAKGLTLRIHENLPVSSFFVFYFLFFVLGKKADWKRDVALCIVSWPFLLARILLMAALRKSSGMYICIWDIEQEGSRVIPIKTTSIVAKKKK